MKVLELFSGTHSIGKVAKKRGWEVVSLDLILPADIKADIMNWDYKKAYKKGEFDIITASPVCAVWSTLKTSRIGRRRKTGEIETSETINRDIENIGKPMVDKVFEIIDYFKPKFWWIENPQTGRMKDYITSKPYYDVDYCKYSDWGYRKRTRFWTNIKGFEPKLCKKDCDSVYIGDKGRKRHLNTFGDRTGKYRVNKLNRYRIPPLLIEELFNAIQLPCNQ